MSKADEEGHIVVEAEDAEHTGDTHEYEFETTGYDDIVVKAEDAEHIEAGNPMRKLRKLSTLETLMRMRLSLPGRMLLW